MIQVRPLDPLLGWFNHLSYEEISPEKTEPRKKTLSLQ